MDWVKKVCHFGRSIPNEILLCMKENYPFGKCLLEIMPGATHVGAECTPPIDEMLNVPHITTDFLMYSQIIIPTVRQ